MPQGPDGIHPWHSLVIYPSQKPPKCIAKFTALALVKWEILHKLKERIRASSAHAIFLLSIRETGIKASHWYYPNILYISGLHQEFPPQGPQEDPHGGETVRVFLARLWLEVCPIRRTDATSQKTHGNETFQVSSLWQNIRQVGSPVTAHEETLMMMGSHGKRRARCLYPKTCLKSELAPT